MTQSGDAQCSDDVFGGLVGLFNAVIFRKFPETVADPDDLEEMVDMLQALRPGVAEVAMLRGLVAVTRRDWQAATAIFVALRERRLCVPSSDAMAAFCMSSLGDANWRAVADELLAGATANASHRQLVRALIAREDLQRATHEAGITGTYTEPASVRDLIDRAQNEQEAALLGMAGAPDSAGATVLPAGAYLRV